MPYTPLPTTPADFPTTYAINCFAVDTFDGDDFELMIHGTDQRRTLETSPTASETVTALCGATAQRAYHPVAFEGDPRATVGSAIRKQEEFEIAICPQCIKHARRYEDA